MDIKAHILGKAGELRVRSELLIRGFSPAIFDQDLGVDIILDNGKRLQIKTSLQPNYTKKAYSWRYTFSVRTPQVRPKIGTGLYEKVYSRESYHGKVDFFIFYLVKDNIFYIIPENEVGKRVSFTIPTPERLRRYKSKGIFKSTSKYEKYKNNWDILI